MISRVALGSGHWLSDRLTLSSRLGGATVVVIVDYFCSIVFDVSATLDFALVDDDHCELCLG